MRSPNVLGFDYHQAARVELQMTEWKSKLSSNRDHGGRHRRVGGDLTAFDARGRMLFEIYDADDQVNADALAAWAQNRVQEVLL